MITAEAADVIEDVFKNRWRTLMSVDDVISEVIGLCGELGVENNTYFFYSSDHGFQLVGVVLHSVSTVGCLGT